MFKTMIGVHLWIILCGLMDTPNGVNPEYQVLRRLQLLNETGQRGGTRVMGDVQLPFPWWEFRTIQ